eukprot:GHVN01009750.1.p3 GENE.GHVN01009750.1~~GHVN01009750.1.p3  ORF type:complete len:410 (-),score=78.93 GHVN01009750.1:8-1237(-)
MKKTSFVELSAGIVESGKERGLEKNIERLEEKKKPIKRTYEEIRRGIRKWDGILEGDGLVFPLPAEKEEASDGEHLKPSNDFEEKLLMLLEDRMIATEKQILEEEEKKLDKYAPEEKKRLVEEIRRGKIMKFYAEKEAQRKNRIKSKKYRKMLKKKKESQTPVQSKEEEERRRVEERMVLKRRRGGRFSEAVASLQDELGRAQDVECRGVSPEPEQADKDVDKDSSIAGEAVLRLGDIGDAEDTPAITEVAGCNGRINFSHEKAVLEEKEQKQVEMVRAALEDDYFDEFNQENKQEAGKSEKPMDIGWSRWAGPGIAEQPQAIPKKTEEKKKTASHVIINPLKQNSLYAAQAVPKGYKSYAEYCEDMGQPLGRGWNNESVFQKKIKPAVTVRAGMAICPPDKPVERKRK